MKTSTKLIIIAFCMVFVGLTLIVLGWTVYADNDFAGGKMPHFGLFIPGIFITFLSIPLWFLGLIPRIAKAGAKLQNEALDNAGKDMSAAMKKSADIASPAIKTVTTTIVQSIKNADVQTAFCKRCGKEIAADSDYCRFCGEKQS